MPDHTITDWVLTTDIVAGTRRHTSAVDAYGALLGVIFPSAIPERGWCVSVRGLPGVCAYCLNESEALVWLQHFAALATRQVQS